MEIEGFKYKSTIEEFYRFQNDAATIEKDHCKFSDDAYRMRDYYEKYQKVVNKQKFPDINKTTPKFGNANFRNRFLQKEMEKDVCLFHYHASWCWNRRTYLA